MTDDNIVINVSKNTADRYRNKVRKRIKGSNLIRMGLALPKYAINISNSDIFSDSKTMYNNLLELKKDANDNHY